MKGWFRAWRARRDCFHHDPSTGVSWLMVALIDYARARRFECSRCGRVWFTGT